MVKFIKLTVLHRSAELEIYINVSTITRFYPSEKGCGTTVRATDVDWHVTETASEVLNLIEGK